PARRLGRPRTEDHFLALRSGRREAKDARGSWQEVRRDPRTDSPAAEYRALAIAPGSEQERSPGRRRAAGRGLRKRARGEGVRALFVFRRALRRAAGALILI